MVRGVVTLPNGTGKNMKVLALVTQDKESEAKDAGADYVGLDEFIKKIEGGWTDMDVIVTMPTVMAKVGKLGRVLGPRGLMPNPKSGTVTLEVGKAITEVKAGKIDFKVDKFGIISVSTRPFQKSLWATWALIAHPNGRVTSCLVTSNHFCVMPASVLVAAQSATPRCSDV